MTEAAGLYGYYHVAFILRYQGGVYVVPNENMPQ